MLQFCDGKNFCSKIVAEFYSMPFRPYSRIYKTQKKPHNQLITELILRKLGDSNPRYGNPYVSLANWWFQPLTQTSFLFVAPTGLEPVFQP